MSDLRSFHTRRDILHVACLCAQSSAIASSFCSRPIALWRTMPKLLRNSTHKTKGRTGVRHGLRLRRRAWAELKVMKALWAREGNTPCWKQLSCRCATKT
jgi:hypothetical protein